MRHMNVDQVSKGILAMPTTQKKARRRACSSVKDYICPILGPCESQSTEPSYVRNSIRYLLSTLLSAAVLFLGGANTSAKADVMQAYFKTFCDAKNGIARIESKWAPLSSPPEGFPYTADNIPGATDQNQAFSWNAKNETPFFICNLGAKRLVAIKGYTGPKPNGPGDIGIWLYIGGRFTTKIQMAFFSTATIIREKDDFFVELSKCNENQECQNQRLTSPSFVCDKATLAIEKGVCLNNNLSALDTELYAAYQRGLPRTLQLSRNALDLEADWLKKLSLQCLPAQADASWPSQPYLTPEQAECVEKLYIARLQVIKKLDSTRPIP